MGLLDFEVRISAGAMVPTPLRSYGPPRKSHRNDAVGVDDQEHRRRLQAAKMAVVPVP